MSFKNTFLNFKQKNLEEKKFLNFFLMKKNYLKNSFAISSMKIGFEF